MSLTLWNRDEEARAALQGRRVHPTPDPVDRLVAVTGCDPWWRDPVPIPAPGETTLHAIECYRTENAYLRLRLADRALMDRLPWHEGRWIPHLSTNEAIDADDMGISDAAAIVGVSRAWLSQCVTKGEIPSKQYLNGRRVRVADVRAWKEAHEARRRVRDRHRTATRRALRTIASLILVLSLASVAHAQLVVPEGQREGPPSAAITATFATGSPRDPASLRLEWDPPPPGTVVRGWAVYLGPVPGQWTERVDVGNAGGYDPASGGRPWACVQVTAPGTYYAVVVAYVDSWAPSAPPPFTVPINLRLLKGQ